MRRMCLVVVVALGLALSGIAAPVYPQQTKDKDKFLDRLETLTVWKMIEALDLDKPTSNKVMEIRSKFLAERKRLQKDLKDDFQRLRQLLQQPAKSTDEAELSRIVTDVREKRKRLSELYDAQYDEVAKVLSVRQQAQLILFLKEFRKEIHAILDRQPGPPREPGKGGGLRQPFGQPHSGSGPPPGSAGPSGRLQGSDVLSDGGEE
ncbi:MAG: hypothetical protein HY913_11445 [Desulfomonile tiedjei]|nr:hypothetical protein [Desulfomonile tiedjei]